MIERAQLLLVPGLVLNGAVWQAQIEALRDIADCWVAPLPPYDDLGAIAEDIIAEAPESFAMAGVSMGGFLCFEILRRVPERVTRMMLIATNADPEAAAVTGRRHVMMEMAERRRLVEMWREYLPRYIHEDGLRDEVIVDNLLKQAFEVGTFAFLQHHRAMIKRTGYRDLLPGIRCPTLIVSGRHDRATPVAAHEAMARAIPGARLLVLEHCGHMPPLEKPAAVSAAMRHWLMDDPVSVAA